MDTLWKLLADQGPLVVLLVLILLAGAKRLWVWGWLYAAKEKEAEDWKAMALRGTLHAEAAVDALALEKRRRAGDGPGP